MQAEQRLRAAGRLAENVPLGPLTTYKFGGPARFLVTLEDEADVRAAFEFGSEADLPVVALGRGSNVVVADSGFEGIVIQAGTGLSRREVGEETTAGGGAPLPLLARETAKAGRGGLEFFAGIPGSVGGAVRMNAGCHGSETKDVLVSARVYLAGEGEIRDLPPAALGLSYRHSDLDDSAFVIGARFTTVVRDPEAAEATIREITRWRKENQPGGTLNAGSVFKNPPGDAAGRIIDSLGLKGATSGAASVSRRHANFFVAGDDAVARDVFDLVLHIQESVRAATGVELEPEIRFLGDFE